MWAYRGPQIDSGTVSNTLEVGIYLLFYLFGGSIYLYWGGWVFSEVNVGMLVGVPWSVGRESSASANLWPGHLDKFV